jgi:hypothetical protein
MRTLSLRPEDLSIQSFPTGPQALRGGVDAAMNTAGNTCGNPPASDPDCRWGRDAPTRIIQCCI